MWSDLFYKQVWTLLYRNYLLTKRKKCQTFQMVLWPIYIVTLLVVMKIATYKPTSFEKMDNNDTVNLKEFLDKVTHIYIAPISDETTQFRQDLQLLVPNAALSMYRDKDALEDAYRLYSTINPFGIYFNNLASSSISDYAIRYPYGQVPSRDEIDGSATSCRGESITAPNYCPANTYLLTGFTALQTAIDTVLIKKHQPNFTMGNITVQRMPRPGAISNFETFTIVTALYLVFAMSPFMIILMVNVVAEKERKIKEAMKIMGLSNIALWISWAMTYGVILLVMTLIMAAIAVGGQLFENSNFFIVFLLFFLYGLSIEMMGFMLATFFTNSRSAGIAGSFINLLLSLLYLIVPFVSLSRSAIWALNLFSPTGFAIAVSEVAILGVTGNGIQFSNLWAGERPVGITLVMLVVDIVLYFLLTLYFDNVVPSEYGQRKPFYFFLLPSYWCPKPVKAFVNDYQEMENVRADEREAITEDMKGKEAIRFSNLTKIFKSGPSCFGGESISTTAVNQFSLGIYEGQITALLGHNGAGKTTLFNILTGFVDATSGSASVYNLSVSNSTQLAEIRRMTGFCPQHNILFDVLTVKEHLFIFAGIKGISKESATSEVDRVLKLIGLEDKAESFSKNLSGGQKRKLSVGIAIIGDPKVLILDEPTAGMDPYSRHNLWDVLRSRKGNRVTLLTTHFMDEADILADRKAIVSRGKLRCVGTSLFLKNRFGIGYHLGIVTKTAGEHPELADFVTSRVAGAEVQRSTGYEQGYVLPITEVGKFADLFRDLETDGDNLNVQSFGVSMTSLEEVFLKIGEEDEAESDSEEQQIGLKKSNDEIIKRLRSYSTIEEEPPKRNGARRNGDTVNITLEDARKFNPAIGKIGEQNPVVIFFALVKKQCLLYVRNPSALFFGLFFPIGLAIGGIAVLNLDTNTENINDPPSISLTAKDHSRYLPFLYKNSTGSPLNDFVTSSPVPPQLSSLNNLYQTRGEFSYLASDIARFEASNISYRALYNTSGTHSLPCILNTMSQALLKSITSSAAGIQANSKRWPALTPQPQFNGGAFGGVLMSAFAVVMTTGLAAIMPVYERELKIRSQLRVSGVRFSLYWFSSFFADYLWYLFVAIAFFIGVVAFNVQSLTTPGALASLILLFIGAGMSCVMTSYCASFIFQKHETASSSWINLIQLFTLVPYTIVTLLDQLSSATAALALNIVFVLLNPYYTIFSGIYYTTKIYMEFALAGKVDNIPTSVYFDWSRPMVPFSILMAYLQFFMLFFVLKGIDVLSNGGSLWDVFPCCNKRKHAVHQKPNLFEENIDEVDDDDVKEESRKVDEIVREQAETRSVVLIQNLRKEFVKRSKKKFCKKQKKEDKIKVAVANLSLTLTQGEVLGLLGPNGAGKTTAISVLTGDHNPTRGKVFVSGHDIRSNLSEAFKDMGYCPQDSPLWENLTLEEHLQLYAVTRGVHKDSVQTTIDNYVDALDIREHMKKRAKALSGGTKRKLCFAMSMLGNPQVVLLDEPSTGMDPKTKRFMWETISSAFEGTNRGAILTTHYMDEADALCSRVAIMVLGKLRCVGSTQHLKGKFGQGYLLEIKMRKVQDDDSLQELISSLFPNVSDPDRFGPRFVYKILQQDVTSLSKVFATFEDAKDRLGIEEYSFSQSTLEQVFLQFAREQDARETEDSQSS